jgi:hypothetical protein
MLISAGKDKHFFNSKISAAYSTVTSPATEVFISRTTSL